MSVVRHKLARLCPAHFSYWRRITSCKGLSAGAAGEEELLVLDARHVPFQICRAGRRTHVYVPALLERKAKEEIAAYRRENVPRRLALPGWPLFNGWQYAPLFLIPLLFAHICRINTHFATLPDAASWLAAGSLDSIRILFHGEWWRLATSLSLHADGAHLGGNLFFGAVFIILLARLCGTGMAWLITLLGGITGNAFSLLIHTLTYRSIGFSTALFAAAGAIGALAICRSANRLFAPFAAAIGLLAMLGTGGVHTDYGAHLCGMAAGFVFGALDGVGLRKQLWLPPQWICGLAAMAVLAGAWLPVLLAGIA